MATHNDLAQGSSASRPPAPAGDSTGKLVEYEQFIEAQLRKTRSHVRSVDIAGSLMTFAAGALAFFLAAAVVDHWVVSGGMGFWGRMIAFLALVVAGLVYLATQVLPLVVRRINPMYAAQTIERSRPTLKNGLMNFLFFRENPAGLSPVVYEAIEEQAATNLAKAHVEAAVDRSKLVHIGYVLLAVVLIVCALYTVISPKDLLQTAGRIVLPWADIGAPTSTTIGELAPGDTKAFRGQQITVSARIKGLPVNGKVLLRYTTADGQIVDRTVEMQLDQDGYKHSCVLPAGDAALQQNLEYRIQAGDAVTKDYRVEVVAAPTIIVRSVTYQYPKYTGLVDQRVEHQGDIRAIEGTEVTLDALANQEIQSAYVDLDCEGKLDLLMQSDKQEAQSTFRLALKEDRQTPEHGSYQLSFKNLDGQQNPEPVRHQIDVIRDLPPEVQMVAPKKDDLELPLDASTQVEVVANDPDFALAQVKLLATKGEQPLLDETLLNETRPGQFVRKFRIDPRKLGLKIGDVVDYWVVAEDNKQPGPNRTQTAKRRIRVVSPDGDRSSDQLAQNGRAGDIERRPSGANPRGGENDRPRERQPTERAPEKQDERKAGQRDPQAAAEEKQPAEQKSEKKSDDQPSSDSQEGNSSKGSAAERRANQESSSQQETSEPSIPSDGSDDGDAIERILEHRDQTSKGDSKPGDERRQAKRDTRQSADKNQDQADAGQQDRGGQQSQSDERREPAAGKQAKDRQKHEHDESSDENNAPDQQSADRERQNADRGDGDTKEDEKQNSKSGQQKSDPSERQKQQPQGDKSQGDKSSGAGNEGAGNDSSGQGKGEKKGQGQQRGQGQSGNQSGSGQQQPSGQEGGAKGSQAGKGQQGKSDAGQQQRDQGGSERGSPSGKGKDRNAKSSDQQGANSDERGEGTPQDKSSEQRSKKGDGKQDAKSTDKADGQEQRSNDRGQSKSSKPDDQGGARKQDGSKEGKQNAEPADESAKDESSSNQAGEKSEKRAAERDKRGAEARENPTRENNRGENAVGKGAQSKGDPTAQDRQPDASKRDKDRSDAKGGDGENEKGNSGAGQSGKDDKGSPSPTEKAQPRNKTPKQTSDEKQNNREEDGRSAADTKKESDSEGGDSGDRAGGGKQGGGQKANKSGTGGAGQNTAADKGAGASNEAGQGEDSNRAGKDRESSGKTGQGGTKPGDGSGSKPSSGEGGKPGQGSAPQSGDSSATPGSENGQPSGSQSSGQPQGGKPGGAPRDQQWQPSVEEAEAANLEYARKATDLALSHLKDELKKDKPDPELLKRLGWTPKELQAFVNRWEQMRRHAQVQGEEGRAARKELDDVLRSLGLRPRAATVKGSAARDDQSRGYKESRRTTPPSEYAEQSRAYSQGTARGEK